LDKNSNFKTILRNISSHKDTKILLILLGILVFSSLFIRNFNTWRNLRVILINVPIVGIVGIGVTMLMISGEFDLSVGSIVAFGPFVMLSLVNTGIPIYISLILSLLAGVFVGFLNGFIVTNWNIPSLIVTLGAAMIWRGATLILSQGSPSTIPKHFPLRKILAGELGKVPVQFIWFLLLAIILWIILEYSYYGNWVFATGGNRMAAEARGINTSKIKIFNFMIVGLLSSFAGLVQLSQLGSIFPLQGSGMELSAIASVVIGGTLISGGAGSIIGTFVGVLIISITNNVLILAGAPGYWYQLFVGLIIIVVVIVYSLRRE